MYLDTCRAARLSSLGLDHTSRSLSRAHTVHAHRYVRSSKLGPEPARLFWLIGGGKEREGRGGGRGGGRRRYCPFPIPQECGIDPTRNSRFHAVMENHSDWFLFRRLRFFLYVHSLLKTIPRIPPPLLPHFTHLLSPFALHTTTSAASAARRPGHEQEDEKDMGGGGGRAPVGLA